jgi:hypothetical protein
MGTRFRPRCDYGTETVALVGDAVGHFHPLTAAGITMGFLDVDSLTTTESVRAYRRQRQTRSYIPELLSNALYELFTLNDTATVTLRRAVYRSWRESPQQRLRLMRMLTGADTSRTNFTRALMQIAFHATMDLTGQSISSPALRTVVTNFCRLATWGRWPMAGVIPTGHRGALRSGDWPALSTKGARS